MVQLDWLVCQLLRHSGYGTLSAAVFMHSGIHYRWSLETVDGPNIASKLRLECVPEFVRSCVGNRKVFREKSSIHPAHVYECEPDYIWVYTKSIGNSLNSTVLLQQRPRSSTTSVPVVVMMQVDVIQPASQLSQHHLLVSIQRVGPSR